MKKSKIIIGAVALLGVSIAATTTGTLAWFTATNSAIVSAGNISTIKTLGNLKATIAAGDNTTVDGTTGVNITDDIKLRDLSYGAYIPGSAPTAMYRANFVGGGTTIASYSTVTNATYSDTVAYYARFTIAFSTDDTNADTNYAVLFDLDGSTFTDTTNNSTLGQAIRFGIEVDSKARMVWAPSYNNTVLDTATYVKGIEAVDASIGKDGKVIKKDTANPITKLADEVVKTTAEENTYFVGNMTSATELTATVTIWFEGTDAACITSNTTQIDTDVYTSSMSFYAVRTKAA